MIPRHIPPEPEGDFGPKIIYEPEGILPYLNIVFIHGLGRTSTETWTKEEQQSHAWQARLREHGPLRMARVWTADYHAAKFYQTLFSTPHGAIKGFVDSLWGKLANNVSDYG